jgi:succinate dehydrogenase / fumarate reductase iron-sulfur subunit
MRMFNDGDTITIEPFRAGASVEDLVVDRSAFDRISTRRRIYISKYSGNPVDANAPTNKRMLIALMQRFWCIGCGALCTCKNSSALFWRQKYPSTLCYLKVELKRPIGALNYSHG